MLQMRLTDEKDKEVKAGDGKAGEVKLGQPPAGLLIELFLLNLDSSSHS